MSKEYDDYLKEHRSNVRKGYEWLCDNVPAAINDCRDEVEHSIFYHDESKYSFYEYRPYDCYFYGNDKSQQALDNFNRAWLHHIHNNPHHWQYWILHNDEPSEGMVVLDMPMEFIIEMICDWWAFSWKANNLSEIFTWYDKHKDYMVLSDKTRKTVEDILWEVFKKCVQMGIVTTRGEEGGTGND